MSVRAAFCRFGSQRRARGAHRSCLAGSQTHRECPHPRCSYRAQLRKPFFTNTPTVARIVAAERGVRLKGESGRGGGGDGDGNKPIDGKR